MIMGLFRARALQRPRPVRQPGSVASGRPASVAAELTRLGGASFVTFLPVRGSADDLASSSPLSAPRSPRPAPPIAPTLQLSFLPCSPQPGIFFPQASHGLLLPSPLPSITHFPSHSLLPPRLFFPSLPRIRLYNLLFMFPLKSCFFP